jgi:DNA invertase Pin-like site-specific DNA recombinase
MSTDHQENSIPAQRAWAREAAPKEGVSLLAEFADHGISGGEGPKARRQLQDLLDFCERQFQAGVPVDVVVVWDMDRLSRQNSLKSAGFLDGLCNAGVSRFLTSTEGWLDFDDATQRVMYLIKQDFARSGFLTSLAKNTLRGKKDKALTGAWVGGPAPTGYRLADGFLEPDPITGPVVTRMFQLYASGAYSLRRLAVWLVTQGVKPPRSADGLWRPDVLAGMLTNQVYLGHTVWNARHTGKYARVKDGVVVDDRSAREREQEKRRRKLKRVPQARNTPADVIVRENVHPPLTDPATFAAVAARLAANKKLTGPAGAGGPYFLSGLCRCGACGARMHGESHAGTGRKPRAPFRYYTCSTSRIKGSCWAGKRVNQEFLLDQVVADLQERFADEAALEQVRARIRELAGRADSDLLAERDRLRERVAQLDADIARGNANLLLLPADVLPGAVVQLRAWQTERENLVGRLDRIAVAAVSREELARTADDGIKQLQQLGRLVREAPPETARAALTSVVAGITVHFRRREDAHPRHDLEVTAVDIEYTDWVVSLLDTRWCTKGR